MMPLIISLAILLAVTAVTAWSVRGKTITAPMVVVSIACAGGVGVTGYWVDQYTTCHSRQEGRADVRAVFGGLYDTLEASFPTADALIVELREDLDERLPPIHCDEGLLL